MKKFKKVLRISTYIYIPFLVSSLFDSLLVKFYFPLQASFLIRLVFSLFVCFLKIFLPLLLTILRDSVYIVITEIVFCYDGYQKKGQIKRIYFVYLKE